MESIWLRLKGQIAADRLYSSMQILLDCINAFFQARTTEQALRAGLPDETINLAQRFKGSFNVRDRKITMIGITLNMAMPRPLCLRYLPTSYFSRLKRR